MAARRRRGEAAECGLRGSWPPEGRSAGHPGAGKSPRLRAHWRGRPSLLHAVPPMTDCNHLNVTTRILMTKPQPGRLHRGRHRAVPRRHQHVHREWGLQGLRKYSCVPQLMQTLFYVNKMQASAAPHPQLARSRAWRRRRRSHRLTPAPNTKPLLPPHRSTSCACWGASATRVLCARLFRAGVLCASRPRAAAFGASAIVATAASSRRPPRRRRRPRSGAAGT